MSVEDELFGIRMELKNLREVVSGFNEVDRAQKGVTSSTTKAGTAAERTEKKTSMLSRTYSRLGTAAKYGLGFLGVSGVLALDRAVDASEDLAMATSGLTRNFGFQTNVASRWAAVMHGRSVEPKALTMAFATLSSKMVEAGRTGGTALTSFHQLGITQDEVKRGAKDFEWGLFRVAKALGEEEGGARRSTAAKALLGKGFQTLTPLFSEGAEGLKEQLHWADKYGVTLSTTTKDGLMDMVVAGRESRVAMLGLQIAMTKAAMPAIEAGEEQLHQFIATLNDPDLSADQKMHRIEQQFLGIEDTLIQIITDALPRVAEHGGELGIKLAGAVWHGFLESDLGGKAVIGGWIFLQFGGQAVVRAGAMRVGGLVGTSMGLGLATGAVGAFVAYEVWQHLSRDSKVGVINWGVHAGEWFSNAMIGLVNELVIAPINESLNDLNVLGKLGVSAPQIGEIGGVKWDGIESGPSRGAHGTAPGIKDWGGGRGGESTADKRRAYERLWGQPPPPGPPPWPPPEWAGNGGRRGGGASREESRRTATRRLPTSAREGRGRERRVLQPIHIGLEVDGRTLAEVVRHHVLLDEDLG